MSGELFGVSFGITLLCVRAVHCLCLTRLIIIRSLYRNAVIEGVKTDIWRIDCIGEGTFKHAVRDALRSFSVFGRFTKFLARCFSHKLG